MLAAQDDSIEGIYSTLKRCAQISKAAGGVGLSVSGIRASGSYIRGTNGQSNGLLPMLRVYNNTARFVNQGGGKRQGSFAMYLEPWHADVFAFLDLKKNHGKEESRARDLFYALWVRRARRRPRRARARGGGALSPPALLQVAAQVLRHPVRVVVAHGEVRGVRAVQRERAPQRPAEPRVAVRADRGGHDQRARPRLLVVVSGGGGARRRCVVGFGRGAAVEDRLSRARGAWRA